MKLVRALSFAAIFAASFGTRCLGQVSWSIQSPAGITDDILGVTYANGTFAAVTNQGNLLTSADGRIWSSQTIDAGVLLTSIGFNAGTWVVVGDSGTILTSMDLKTWSAAASGTTHRLNSVVSNGIFWAAVGEAGAIVYSSDARTWTLLPPISGATGSLRSISLIVGQTIGGVYRPNLNDFLVGGEGGVILESNETNFFTTPSGTTQDLDAVLSSDLADPNLVSVLAGSGGTLIYGPGVIFNGMLAPSPSAVPVVTYRALAYGNGFYVAAGDQGAIVSSMDGVHWTQRFSGDSPATLSTATLLAAAYSSTLQRFVVVGTGGTILVSNSKPTVFGNVSTRGYVSSAETFIGGFVVQGTAPSTVLIRGDGPVLSTFSVPSPLPDPVVTVYNNTGAVIATNTGWSTNTSAAAISAASQQVGAFALPSSSADSALLLTLAPGSYTVQITSAGGNSGIALFEAYTE